MNRERHIPRNDGMLGTEGDSDQLQPDDTLIDRGVEDPLDEGYAPPDRAPAFYGRANEIDPTHETFDQRLSAEEPEEWDVDPLDRPDETRAGRLVADAGALDGRVNDTFAEDEGVDGAGASAEEAAVHIVEEP